MLTYRCMAPSRQQLGAVSAVHWGVDVVIYIEQISWQLKYVCIYIDIHMIYEYLSLSLSLYIYIYIHVEDCRRALAIAIWSMNMYAWCVGVYINRCCVFMCINVWYSRYWLDILCTVFNHAITSMMEYPWACNDLMVNPQCNRSPAMWLMLPGILQCRPMEGSTTLINWRLQWWMPWYPVLTGTCAFGRVANLEFRCSDLFGWKKSQFFRLDEKNLQPNAVVLPSQIDLFSLNLVDTQVVFTGYNARSMVPYCGVANGRGLLSMLGELVF